MNTRLRSGGAGPGRGGRAPNGCVAPTWIPGRGVRGRRCDQDGTDGLWVNTTENDYLDAVVLDVMLPGIDGYEVCRRLREAGDGGRRC